MKKIISVLVALLFTNLAFGQVNLSKQNETIINLMEEIFEKIPQHLPEINPNLNRISIYKINSNSPGITPPLRAHFESRLVEIFGMLGTPSVVSLPEMSTLRISSTDSSFSVINALPSPDELWRVGRRLRVDGFLEGALTYIPEKALFLDLRLNRTGTNEVLWAHSYAAYVKGMKVQVPNPLRTSVSAGLEVFTVDFESAADAVLHPDYNNKLVHYALYFGLYQYVTSNSRLRYELRGGVSFLSEGARLIATESFDGSAFYGLKSGGGSFTKPISFNFKALLYATLLQNAKNKSGDWLSVYLSITRYFTKSMPDLAGIGVGFRSDLSSKFSISAGFSMIMGSEFDSRPLESNGTQYRAKVEGLQYEIMMLQYSF